MKNIKKFENEVTKTFTDWLKNPKKPESVRDKFAYYYTCKVKRKFEFNDNVGYDTSDLLKYIIDNDGTNLYDEISNEYNIPELELKNNSDLLDDKFDDYVRKKLGGYQKFMDDYLNYDDTVDYTEIPFIETKFNVDEAYFRVYSIEVMNPYSIKGIRAIPTSIYFKIETSREIEIEEEKNWISEYIYEVISEIEDKMNTPVSKSRKGYDSESGIRFYESVEFDTDSLSEVKIKL